MRKQNPPLAHLRPLLALLTGLCAGCAVVNPAPPERVMVVTPFEEAVFVPVNPDLPEGPQLSVLWGDPATGPSAMLLRLKRGPIPLHTHSSDYHLVVLRGTMKHWGEGQLEAGAKPLGPGSYWFQPGDKVHGDSCLTDDCLVHVVWAGKRDGKLATAREP